jgi:integrase
VVGAAGLESANSCVRSKLKFGLRPGEAYALRVGKFDPLKRTLFIDTSTSGDTKTGEARTVVLPSVSLRS